MESTAVNWEALDALVFNFAESEHLIDDPSSTKSSSSPSSSSYYHRLLIRHIRRCLEVGDVDAAVEALRSHAPSVLRDHRLLFRLRKQKFIELLRRGTAEDRDSALGCLKTELAPCALDAYPEAYEELKHILLTFIFDEHDQKSPVANEWSEKGRYVIAGLISTVLRAHLQAYDPILCMTLRYLISIHKGFCFSQGIVSPISNLTERLILEEHDPPATPHESLYEAPPFNDVDIQALDRAVELTRQGVMDSLRFAKDDLFQAFQNELCRIRMDVSLLDDLVYEYCVYRGFVEPSLDSPVASEMEIVYGPLKLPQEGSINHSSTNGSLGSESVANNDFVNGSHDIGPDMMIIQSYDKEFQYSSETRTYPENCSTSEMHQPNNAKMLERKKSCGPRERFKWKRWMERQDKLGLISEEQDFQSHKIVDMINNNKGKYDAMLAVKELAIRGMAVEVVEEVNTLDPNFFIENPVFLFQLKRVEFLKLVSSGNHSSALKVACSHLGPLALKDPTLMEPLKETMMTLVTPNEDSFDDSLPLHALGSSLQVAIGKRLGIEEPQLMKIIRTTIYTHSEWFKLQMCKDRFEGFLKIEPLKHVEPPLIASTSGRSNIDTYTHESSQVLMSTSSKLQDDVLSSTQVSLTEPAYDENGILKVMEFLDLQRVEAIHLLAQYNGNAENVIQQLFS